MALTTCLLALAVMAACGDKQQPAAAKAGGPGAPPPPEVAVVTVQPGVVALSTELPGRLEASRVAEVRARVAGILQKRLFTEGSNVKAGQRLFTIDPAPYEAALQSAQAQLAQAEASLANASATLARDKPLIAAKAISQQEYDAAVAAEKAAAAQVAAGHAAVRTAGINLGYASVTAPISGRIGRALVTEGALVGQGEATPLALVQQINPLYVNITQPAAQVLQLRQALRDGKLARAGGTDAARVQVLLEDGQPYPQAARLLFTDLSVDPATGEVSVRAVMPNPNGQLLPGMYVRARLEQAQVDGAILLPRQAVTRGSHGDTVMVVAADGAVAPRPVQVGGAQGQNWIITGGLQAGEQVMVEGAMKLMMGAKVVKPVPWQPASAAASAPQAAQAPASDAASAPASAASN
ncbi:MAG: efflux RND transporter periplasmic adaptor subunit [Burkholderiaceae bacterium]|nr:efflux RND transporter periplasmic adaptor subunit [Burkholderiaceae bacterium]